MKLSAIEDVQAAFEQLVSVLQMQQNIDDGSEISACVGQDRISNQPWPDDDTLLAPLNEAVSGAVRQYLAGCVRELSKELEGLGVEVDLEEIRKIFVKAADRPRTTESLA